MKRRIMSFAILLSLVLLLTGCTSQTADPLLKNETTAAPGLSMNVQAASASESNAEKIRVTLYFRYLDEMMLAAESRELTIPRDESVEYAIVTALVEGPSAGHSDLKRLIPAGTKVESVISRDDILFITLDEGFLDDDVPEDWADDEDWKQEAPQLRKLIVQSLVASVTEYSPYTGVQLLLHKAEEVQTSLRLDNAYFLDGSSGVSDPVARDETLLLTPSNTANIVLSAWKEHDYERLYRFVADAGQPSLAAFSEAMSTMDAVKEFNVSGGSVSADGQSATITSFLRILGKDGSRDIAAYPMLLNRENGVWKITYARLSAMMIQ